METYNFYVQMDGVAYGPYTVREIMDLGLLDDTLVTEDSMNGEWLPASMFDFDDMLRKEQGVPVTASVPPQPPLTRERGSNPDAVPAEINSWNWGAFMFSWLWAVCNGVYWPLVIIVCGIIPYVGPFIVFCISVLLGIKGNEWAWKSGRWNSVEHFKSVQHKWAVACLWVLGISVALLLFLSFVIMVF